MERAQGADLTATLRSAIEELRAQVDRLSVAQTARSFSLLLAVSLPALAVAPQAATASVPDPPEVETAALAEENANLRRALLQLQSEMQETNRGVVALYAEVHDQSERLRQEEERMRVLLDSVHDYAICMLAADGEIVSWNAGRRAAVRLLQPTRSSGGTPPPSISPPSVMPGCPAEHLRLAAADGPARV